MNSFSITRKKTPFQKHREEEEAKKKRAEDETARLYAEFVESFQESDTPGSKAFIRGGTINPNEKLKTDTEGGNSKDGVSVPKKGTRYVPSFLPPASRGKEPDKKKEDEKPKEKEKGKPRVIDNFLEELKAEQELREKRNQDREHRRDGRLSDSSAPSSRFDEFPDDFDSSGKLPGSFDDGDPQTTNLYVGNLSPQVDENFLLRTFGRFGLIASVKIMWPRTEEESRRQRNCGFVAFMNRADGQAAKDEMQGVVIYEYELKIAVALSTSRFCSPRLVLVIGFGKSELNLALSTLFGDFVIMQSHPLSGCLNVAYLLLHNVLGDVRLPNRWITYSVIANLHSPYTELFILSSQGFILLL